MTRPSRRVDISGITAPALAISAAYAAASSVDPIFRALKEYLTLSADWDRLCEAEEAAKDDALHGRDTPPADVGDVRQARVAMDRAANRVTATTPTTVAGVAELIRFVMDDPAEVFDLGKRDWPRGLFVAALAGLDNITAAGGRGAAGTAPRPPRRPEPR